jgi:CRISPR/Cas system type I-B associated protein Csh2 (Cas7 group RAMP superfamily)
MAFDKRREYLFLYSVKDANPNGDPLNQLPESMVEQLMALLE